MLPYDQQRPSSVLLQLLDTERPGSCSRQREHRNPSKRSASSASSMSSQGSSVARVSKRKSRAKPKPPVKELLASKFNFRNIVHHFTGAQSSESPTSPFQSCIHANPCVPSAAGNSRSPSLCQQEAMLGSGCIAQSLKALEVIAAYLWRQTQGHETPKDINMQYGDGGMVSCGDLLAVGNMQYTSKPLDRSRP